MQPLNSALDRNTRIMRLRQARVAGQPIRLQIISPSDAEKDNFARLQWSDYWIKYELIKALGQLPDLFLTDYQPHAVLHLFGFPASLDPRIYTLGWLYGHPDMVTDFELAHYDYLYCYSSLFQKELERRGFRTELMVGATSKLPQPKSERRYPVTFVGNARARGGSRPAVEALLESGEHFMVWGKGWEGKLPQKNYAGSYFDYAQLGELYANSEFSLNDHHPDMARWGFVSFRIYDVLAAGGFVVSDRNPGIEEVFGEAVPQFADGKELHETLTYFRAHPEKKERLRKQGMQIALAHTWKAIAKQIHSHLKAISAPEAAFMTDLAGNPTALKHANMDSGRSDPAAQQEAPRLRLNLGCGSAPLKGYLNLDKYPTPGADRVMAADRLYFPDSSVDEIHTSHMVEHLTPEQLEEAIKEWQRVLKPGGKLTVRCPNFEIYLREWLEGDDEYRRNWGRINIFGHSTRGEGLQHRNGFSASLLAGLFAKHGFRTLRSEATSTRPEYNDTIEYRPDGDLLYEGERVSEVAEKMTEEILPEAACESLAF